MCEKVIIRKADRIKYILSGVASFYGISEEELKRNRVRDPLKVDRKRVAMQLLYDIADLSLKEVAWAMGYSAETALATIHGHIAQIRERTDPRIYGNKEFIAKYNKLLKHLRL